MTATQDHSATPGMGGHHLPNQGKNDEWLTPPELAMTAQESSTSPVLPKASTMTIHFDRIGRNRNPHSLKVEFNPDSERSIQALCDRIDRHIRPHLGSRFFDWSMDIDGGPLTIEGGRFGSGTGVVS